MSEQGYKIVIRFIEKEYPKYIKAVYKEFRLVIANSASTERVFRYQLNIDSDCF